MPTTRWKIATVAYWVGGLGGAAAGVTYAGWLGLALWLGGNLAGVLYAIIVAREARRAERL